MKSAHWVLDGPIMEDAGDVGGDIQVGPAISVRFRSDDCPEARFEVTMYATAKMYAELGESEPDCPHPSVILERHGGGAAMYAPMPEEHLACSYKPGTVDVQAQYEYGMDGRVSGGVYESSNNVITYEWVGSDLGYAHNGRTLTGEIEYATADAQAKIMDWVNFVNKYLEWDGRTRPND